MRGWVYGIVTGMVLVVVLGLTTCSPIIIGHGDDIYRDCEKRITNDHP